MSGESKAPWWKAGHGWGDEPEPTIRPVYMATCEPCDWGSPTEYRDSLAALRAVDRHRAGELHKATERLTAQAAEWIAATDDEAERLDTGMVS